MDSAGTVLEDADKDGDVSNDGDVSKRAQKTPERLEYLANLLIMPEYMSQYGLLLQPAGKRLPNGYGNFIKELVQLINDLNHPVMAGKRVGETALKGWIQDIKLLAINHGTWLQDVEAKARNPSVPAPRHQVAAGA